MLKLESYELAKYSCHHTICKAQDQSIDKGSGHIFSGSCDGPGERPSGNDRLG